MPTESSPPAISTGIQAEKDLLCENDRPRGLFARHRKHFGPTAILVVMVIGLYSPTVNYDFLNWDDPWYVVNNELIKSWSPSNMYRLATEPAVKNYAPLTMFSFLLDHTFWGLWPGGFHLTNFLLHAMNAVLVYVLMSRLSKNRFVGWMTAALFALHLVQLESVVWVSSRKGLLSATFVLLSLIHWLQPNRKPKDEGWGLLFLVLALFTKAIAVVVPAVVLLYDLLIHRQKFSDALVRQFIPGLVAAICLFVTMSSQATMYGGLRGHMDLSKLHILAVDSIILWNYMGMLVWPSSLCVLYDTPTSGITGDVVIAVAGWALVCWVTCRWRKQLPFLAFGLLTALVFLLPVLNLTPITTLMNDRYLYLPSIPFFGLATWGLYRACGVLGSSGFFLKSNRPFVQTRIGMLVSGVTFAVILIGVVTLTSRRLPIWRNSTTLWMDAVEKVPNLPVVQYQLADGLYSAGEKERAIHLLNTALANETADSSDRTRFRKTLDNWQANR